MEEKRIYTVVVADDETELREAVCQMVRWEEIGFRLVGSAGNGLDAIQLVEQLQPDLLLTDIRMPFISGVELARQVRELRPRTQIAFLSGYDDFEYAQQAIAYNVIRYLLKPIGMVELTEALGEIHQKMEQADRSLSEPGRGPADWLALVAPLLLDEFTEEQELDGAALAEEAVRAGILAEPSEAVQFTVLATELRSGEENRTAAETARAVDLILEKYFRSRSFCAGGRVLTLLVTDRDFSYLPIALDELVQAVGRVLKLQCRVGVSRPADSLARCHGACREAVDLLRTAPAGESGVYHAPALPEGRTPLPEEIGEVLDRLDGMIRSAGRGELEGQLARIFAACGEDGSLRDLMVLQLLAASFRALHAALPAEQAAEARRRCRIPDSLFSGIPERELQRRVTDLCLTARDLIANQRKEGVSLLCDKAMEAINRSYMDEGLSLGTVSEELHVSPNYLSANMKKYAGDTFINLLIKKRMEVARELLTTTSHKILEVARRCGYSDQHYFSYCFKKYYGLSPAQLRRGGGGKEERP